MVNFKYLSLPILVGLFNVKSALGACTFEDTSANSGTPKHADGNSCTESDGGYHFIYKDPTDPSKGGYVAKYTYASGNGSSGGIVNESNSKRGLFKLTKPAGKFAVCDGGSTVTSCKLLDQPSGSCSSANIGKLVLSSSAAALCLAEYVKSDGSKVYPTLAFNSAAESTGYYFLQHNKDSLEAFRNIDDTFKTNFYAVTSSSNTILFSGTNSDTDLKYSSKGFMCADLTSKARSRKEDLCDADNGSGKYFKCDGGKCTSYKQDNSDVQENNNESCNKITSGDNIGKYEGNCTPTYNDYYIVNSSGAIVTAGGSGTLNTLTGSGLYTMTAAGMIANNYYVNADPLTKQTHPLIKCTSTSSCTLTQVDAPGYYLNIPDSDQATGVKCTSNSECVSYTTVATCASNIGGVVLGANAEATKFCNDGTGVVIKNSNGKEYIISVDANAFPGVSIKSNVAVKIEYSVSSKTIKLIEKRDTCNSDGDLIKKADGKFYYCITGTEVEIKADGAKFSIGEAGKLIKINANGPEVIEASDQNTGYYINRKNNKLVKCVDNTAKLSCTEQSQAEGAYINAELKFPINGIERNSKLIICESGVCRLPDDDNFGKSKFFTNKEKGLLDCTSGTCGYTEPATEAPTQGYYLNGLKDKTLIYCVKGTAQTSKVECTVKDGVSYGYYVSHSNELISCNAESCVSTPAANLFSGEPVNIKNFMNSGLETQKPLIQCTNEGCELNNAPEDYYVDDSQTSRYVIKCTKQGNIQNPTFNCQKMEAKDRAVYISDAGKRLISCDRTHCSIIADSVSSWPAVSYYLNADTAKPLIKGDGSSKWVVSDGAAGVIYKNTNGASQNYPFIYCTTATACIEVEETATDKSYLSIDATSKEPTITKTDVNLNTDTTTLPTGVARANGGIVGFIIDSTNGKILSEKTDNAKLVVCEQQGDNKWKCTSPTSGLKAYYINAYDEGLIVISGSAISEVIPKAKVKSGYYFMGTSASDKTIKCVNNGEHACTIISSYATCGSDTVGQMKANNKLCIKGSNDFTITSATAKFMITAGSSSFPGVTSGNILIAVDNKKIVREEVSGESYFLINESATGDRLATANQNGSVYKCVGEAVCEKLAYQNVDYVNSDPAIGNKIIQCTTNATKCVFVDPKQNPVYCVSKDNKLAVCTKANMTGKTCLVAAGGDTLESYCSKITAKEGYYVPYEKNGLIMCNASTCVLKTSATDVQEGYYISQDSTNGLIRCDVSLGSVRCDSVAVASSGVQYYIKSGLVLIRCENGVCEEKAVTKDVNNSQWFVGGVAGSLIKCPKNSEVCINVDKAVPGWYYNKIESEEKKLVKCTSSGNSIVCNNVEISGEGEYIPAVYEEYLIHFTGITIGTTNVPDSNKYYINGENKKLIKCESHSTCEVIDAEDGWYFDTQAQAIKCTADGCKTVAVANANKGYYVNSDYRKDYIPMIQVIEADPTHNNFVNVEIGNIENGWYVNADSDSATIIQCQKGLGSGSCQTETLSPTCTTDSAKFARLNGEMTWCVGGADNVRFPADDANAKTVLVKASTISWLGNTGNDDAALFTVGKDQVKQKKIDGYYFDQTTKSLYFCKTEGTGLCTKQAATASGYYLDYTNRQFYRCTVDGGNMECNRIQFDTRDSTKNVQCDSQNELFNVVIDGNVCPDNAVADGVKCKSDGDNGIIRVTDNDRFKLCGKNVEDMQTLKEIDNKIVESLYAIESRKFPGVSSRYRYVLLNVSKYRVTLKAGIDEVSECPDAATGEDGDSSIACLKDKNTLLIKKTLQGDSGKLPSENDIQISKDGVIKAIESDYDTNDGYFTYETTSGKHYLKSVVIKEDSSIKWECEIGGACEDRPMGEKPIKSFKLENGVLKMEKDTTEVVEGIRDGWYLDDGEDAEPIYCKEGACSRKTETGDIEFNEGKISVGGVSGHNLYTQLIFNSISGNLRKRDGEDEVFIMNELTAVQYNEGSLNGVVNIFVDTTKNRKVTTENDISNAVGYHCKTGRECYKINVAEGSDRYYLNTAQAGKVKNAIAKCTNDGCSFIDAVEGLVYENAGATSFATGIIVCDNSKCEAKAPATAGLPACKSYIKGNRDEAVVSDADNKCVTEDLVSLEVEQHCLWKGSLYKTGSGGCEEVVYNTMKLFDSTSRLIDMSKIDSTHYGVSLYDCSINDKCYLTYGYIVNENGRSRCDEGVCVFSKTTLDTNCDVVGRGALVQDGGDVKLCTNGESPVNTVGYYYVTLNVRDTFPKAEFGSNILVSVSGDSEKVMSLVNVEGYLLVGDDNAVVSTNGSTGVLYYCHDGQCTKVESPEVGFYRSERYDTYILCNRSECKMTDKSGEFLPNSNDSLSIKFAKDEKLYFSVPHGFVTDSVPIIAEATKYKISVYKVDNFVLLNTEKNKIATGGESVNGLFVCKSDLGKCEAFTVVDGWFAGQGGNGIKCASGICQVVESLKNSCSSEGELVYNNGQYGFCTENRVLRSISELAGKMIKFKSSNVFPNGKNYVVVYANYVVGLGFIDSENGAVTKSIEMETCSQCRIGGAYIGNGEYCMDNQSTLYVYNASGSTAAEKCKVAYDDTTKVLVFDGHTLADTAAKAKGEGRQMLYCDHGVCRVISGYVKIGSDMIYCNYAKCDAVSAGSVVGEVNPNGYSMYYLKNGATVTGAMASEVNALKYYEISGNHKFPGAESRESFLVEAGTDYFVPWKVNEEGYYLIKESGEILKEEPTEPTTGVLYQCDANSNCKRITNAGNGFYVNSAVAIVDRYKKGMIKCSDSLCGMVVTSDILTTITINQCSKDQVGKLYRKTNDKIKLCVKQGGRPEDLDISDNVKYQILAMESGNVFGSVVVAENGDPKSIILEIKKGRYVKHFVAVGYALLSRTNELMQSVGPANDVTLYNCSTNECKAVANPQNGYYLNSIFGDRRYIKCEAGKFEIVNAAETENCDGTGKLIYNQGFKLCQTLDKVLSIGVSDEKMEYVVNVSDVGNFPGIATAGVNALLAIEKGAVTHTKGAETNVVVRNDYKLVFDEQGILYHCDAAGLCEENKIPRDGYYLKVDYDKDKTTSQLVLCNEKKCKASENVDAGFYPGASRQLPLIQCVKPKKAKADTNPVEYEDVISKPVVCKERDGKDGWYLTNSNTLIHCTKESGCNDYGNSHDGWYSNGAYINYKDVVGNNKITEEPYSPVLKCSNGQCTASGDTYKGTCEKVGDIIVSGTTIKFCTTNTASTDMKNSISYEIINNENFSIGGTGYIPVAIGDNKVVVAERGNYLKGSTMYDCNDATCNEIKSNDKNGVYLWERVTKTLRVGRCENERCISWTAVNAEGNYVLNSYGKLVADKNDNVDTIYECTKVGNTIKCANAKDVMKDNDSTAGYYLYTIGTEKVIYKCVNNVGFSCILKTYDELPRCTSVGSHLCTISYPDEPDTETYRTDVVNEPVINAGEVCLDIVNNNKNVYFTYKEVNTGFDEANCLLLSNDIGNFEVGVFDVFEMTKSFVRPRKSNNLVFDGLNSSHLINRSNNLSGLLVDESNGLVRCIGEICTKEVQEVSSCAYDYKEGKCTSTTAKNGQICKSAEGRYYLITDKNNNICVHAERDWAYSKENTNLVPEIENERSDALYFVTEGVMYRIKDTNVYIEDEGVYLLDSANKRVHVANNKSVDIAAGGEYRLYVCTEDGCVLKTSCENGKEFILDNGRVMKCAGTSVSYNNNSEGYYLNGPWKNLIKCEGGQCIEQKSDKSLEGYYVNSGDYQKIIKCSRDDEKFQCVLEEARICNYKEDIENDRIVCKSKVDIPSQSYCLNFATGVTKPTMLYIEHFIKAYDLGECLVVNNENERYFHYRRSKFLGHDEVDEVLKLQNNAVVKVYEPELGYYIVSTESGKGITDDVERNEARLYECTKTGCIEQMEPVKSRIYVNSASAEKLVRFDGDQWNVLRHSCIVDSKNTKQCKLAERIYKRDIIYQTEKERFVIAKKYLGDGNVVLDDVNIVAVKDGHYLRIDSYLYVFDKSHQFFERINESGYYVFNNNDYNLEPFYSTVNQTITNEPYILKINDSGYVNNVNGEYIDGSEQFIWNKADLEKEGRVLQFMHVYDKVTPVSGLKKRDGQEPAVKYRSINQRCTSNQKNKCLSAGDKIEKGSACVVVDGDFKGLYLATETIEKNGSAVNCVRYDNGDAYKLVEGYKTSNTFKERFAGSYQEYPRLARVEKNRILLSNDNGYYVVDGDRKLVTGTQGVSATAYKCKEYYDVDPTSGQNMDGSGRYECRVVNIGNNEQKYIYSRKISKVLLHNKSNKWSVVDTSRGYYFFNGEWEAAIVKKVQNVDTPDTIITSFSGDNGDYLNGANLNEDKPVVVNKGTGIINNYKTCTIGSGNKCTFDANVVPVTGETCYSNKKLYVVEAKEDENNGNPIYYCYTGSTTALKYKFLDSTFYRLDGTSVQKPSDGVYVLNSNYEEVSFTNPEVPGKLISCSGGNCSEVQSLELDVDVVVNKAGTGVNRLMIYHKDAGKFENVHEPGYYFLDVSNSIEESLYQSFVFTDNGELKKIRVSSTDNTKYSMYNLDDSNEVMIDFKEENIYINKAKEGSFMKDFDKFELEGLSIVDGHIEYNNDDKTLRYGKNEQPSYLYKDSHLYRIEEDQLVLMTEGIFFLNEGKAFVSEEWTEINSETICNAVEGYCSTLPELTGHRYFVNHATHSDSIVEYDAEEQKWRMVTADGVYAFFEDGYNVDAVDRRVWKVFEVVGGETVDITESENRYGYYLVDDLIIESNELGWMDAKKAVDTVNVKENRICQSYEAMAAIDASRLCFDKDLGLCVPKSTLTNESDDMNCIFSLDKDVYYFLVDGKLYSISGQAFRQIRQSGLYVIDMDNKVFQDTLERKANAYKCSNGECQLAEGLDSGYYVNMADEGLEIPTILYYNDDSKAWRSITDDGQYFFNKLGYPAVNGDEVAMAFDVSKNGRVVRSVLDDTVEGIFINRASETSPVVVEYKKGWQKAREIPTCTVELDGRTVQADVVLHSGDVCVDGSTLVFITRGKPADQSGRKRDDDANGEPAGEQEEDVDVVGAVYGIVSEDGKVKYGVDATDGSVVRYENGRVIKMLVNGYVVIDKINGVPVDSTESVQAYVYKCVKGVCAESSVGVDGHVFNVIADKYPLVTCSAPGKWKVEADVGYYFFGTNYDVLAENGFVGKAVEVEVSGSGEIIQTDISESKRLGHYVNRAASTLMVVSNDEYFWSKGKRVTSCSLFDLGNENGKACRTASEQVKVELGDVCVIGEDLYIVTSEATSTSDSENCVTSGEKTVFVDKNVVDDINGGSAGESLVQMSRQGFVLIKDGYYYLNEDGTEVADVAAVEDATKIRLIHCAEGKCEQVTVEGDVMVYTEKGEIISHAGGKLSKVIEEGLYFFNSGSQGCQTSEDDVAFAVRITSDGQEVVDLSTLTDVMHINAVNKKSAGVSDGEGHWAIEVNECKVNGGVCSVESGNLEVGSLCIVDGSFYVITQVDVNPADDSEIAKCVQGDDANPLYKREEDEVYVMTKEAIRYISEEGFYAFEKDSFAALHSEEFVKNEFMYCGSDGQCTAYNDIIKNGHYLNRAPAEKNIVHFDESSKHKANTIENHCVVQGNKCSVEGQTLVSGDLCVNGDAIYVMKDESECVATEKFVESYQYINKKIYKLGVDVVVQMFDGYYFVDSNQRNIVNPEDYGNEGTVAYICSNVGECNEIVPYSKKYYKDYTTIKNGKFRVVMYDPDNGYVLLDHDGVIRLADNTYARCAFETNGEVACSDIKKAGIIMTVEDELVTCTKNESKEIECIEESTGGYYMVEKEDEKVLMLCESNEEKDKLVCNEVKKEGFFMDAKETALYECIRKPEDDQDDSDEITLSVASVTPLSSLGQLASADVGIAEDVDGEENVEGDGEADGEENEEDNGEGENNEEPVEEIPPVPEPMDVVCTPKECVENTYLYYSKGEEIVNLYLCVNVNKNNENDAAAGNNAEPVVDTDTEEEEEDEEEEEEDNGLRWIVVDKECKSSSYHMFTAEYFSCIDEVEGIDPDKVKKPNSSHTLEADEPVTKTKSTKTSEPTKTTESEKTTTTKESTKTTDSPKTTTSKEESKTTTTAETTTTTTTTTSSKTSEPTTTTKKSGAISRKSLPSIAIYLLLFAMAWFIQF